MKLRHLAAGLLVGALALSACGKEGSPGAESSGPTQSAASGVTVEGSPTFAAMTQRGRVVIGVKEDQPGLGFKDATTGQYSGFDIEIARLVAAKLGFGPDKIDYKAVPSAPARTRSPAARSTTTSARTRSTTTARSCISFAGPYFVAGQSLLVRSDETAITEQGHPQGQEGLLGHGLHADPAGQGPAADRAREHRRVPELQPVRGPAALEAGRRGHHGRRDPQGLRRAAARQAEGRRPAVLDRALRHRAQPRRRRAPRQDQRHPGGRRGRRHLEADLRRDARQVRLPGRPAASCSATSHIRCGVGRDTATHPACAIDPATTRPPRTPCEATRRRNP